MIEPTIEALTTSWRPSFSANRAMISSGALPKVTFESPPIPGPDRAASSSVARPMSAAVGMIPSAAVMKITVGEAWASSSPTASRDERHQQVRPALRREQEARTARLV